MNIVIAPGALILFVIITANCIIGLVNNKIWKIIYVVFSSLLSLIGIAGAIAMRFMLVSNLDEYRSNNRLSEDFIAWALEKYDHFALFTLIAVGLIVIASIFLMHLKNDRNDIMLSLTTSIINMVRAILLAIMVVYSYRTINKEFNVARYIADLYVAEAFILYIPEVVRKVILLKRDSR